MTHVIYMSDCVTIRNWCLCVSFPGTSTKLPLRVTGSTYNQSEDGKAARRPTLSQQAKPTESWRSGESPPLVRHTAAIGQDSVSVLQTASLACSALAALTRKNTSQRSCRFRAGTRNTHAAFSLRLTSERLTGALGR